MRDSGNVRLSTRMTTKFYFRPIVQAGRATVRLLSDALESSIIQLTSGRIWRAEIESFGLALQRDGESRGSNGREREHVGELRVSELRNQITGYC